MLSYPWLVDSWVIWFMGTAKIQLLISHKLSIQPFHPMPGYEGLWWTEGTKDRVLWPWNELGFSKRNQKERNNKWSSTCGRCQTSDSWNWTVISRQEQEHLVQMHWSSQSSDYLSICPWLLIMCCGRGRYGWKEIAPLSASYKPVNIIDRNHLISAWEILGTRTDFRKGFFFRTEKAQLALRNNNTNLREASIAEEWNDCQSCMRQYWP